MPSRDGIGKAGDGREESLPCPVSPQTGEDMEGEDRRGEGVGEMHRTTWRCNAEIDD